MIDNDFEDKFAQLVELAQKDPTAFEEYRKDLLSKEITRMCGDDTKKLERYERLQRHLEQDLSKYSDPIERYDAMVKIFYGQLEEFKKALNIQATLSEAKQNSDILSFPKKK